MSRHFLSSLGALILLALLTSPAWSQVKPTAVSHDLEGKDNCLMCHAAGVMEPVPDVPAETHEGRGNEHCTWCHKPAGG